MEGGTEALWPPKCFIFNFSCVAVTALRRAETPSSPRPAKPSGVRGAGAAMSGGEVVCQGWLRKSPPEKKLRRYVSPLPVLLVGLIEPGAPIRESQGPSVVYIKKKFFFFVI